MSARLFRGNERMTGTFPWGTFPVAKTEPEAVAGTTESVPLATKEPPIAPLSAFEAEVEALRNELDVLRCECDARVEDARRQGQADGQQISATEMQAEREDMQRQLASSLSEMLRVRQNILEQADEDLVRLAVAIAEKVLNRELHTDSDALRGIARAAIDRVAGKEIQSVRMHPADQQAVEKELSENERRVVRLLPDPGLSRGALLFETEFGTLDCSASTQLEEIERGLTDRLRRSNR